MYCMWSKKDQQVKVMISRMLTDPDPGKGR